MSATVAWLLLSALVHPPATPPRPPHRAGPDTPVLAQAYLPRYAELRALAPLEDQSAKVQGLTIQRDIGTLTLTDGTLFLLTPVGGSTVGVVFHGRGLFTFVPPTRIEKDRLHRYEQTDSLSSEFTDLVLLFTDTTLAELQGKLKFGHGSASGDLRNTIKTSLDYLGDEDNKSFDPDLMADFLNAEHSGLFYAYINRDSRGPLMFMVNPIENEAIRLMGQAAHRGWSRDPEVICLFPARGFVPDTGYRGERVAQADVKAYKLEVWMPQTGGAGLGFSAAAHIEVASPHPVGPWITFVLFNKLDIDSARTDAGEPATVFKGKDDYLVWIRLPGRLEPGKTAALTLYYHGDLMGRYGEFYALKSSIDWYPASLEGRALATFDITYHSPQWLQLASVGSRVDSTAADRMSTTHWVTDHPIRNASFNLGNFKAFHAQEPGSPPVTVLISEDAHRTSEGGGGHQKNMKEAVGADMTGALKFFAYVYGPAPVNDFVATEIPYNEGEAFPGLIDLSLWTFQYTDKSGEDQIFRAHEVAHQWWGIGVDYATYHDRWLSEGFSEFSGLWYMQTVLKDNTKYFDALDRWKASLLVGRNQRTPISLGYRTQSGKDELGYQEIVYYKGAWVLHMLRGLMIDLKTMNEDRFTGLMRQFFAAHVGGRASIADFRRATEQATGVQMDWFFNQWVDGYQIPTYKVATQTQQEGGQYRVHLKVTQENVPESFLMYVPVTVDLGDKKLVRLRVKVTGHQSIIDLPPLPSEPKGVKFNDLDGVLAEVNSVSW